MALPHLQAEQRVQKNPVQLAGKQPRSRQSSPNRSRSPCTPRRASPQAGSDGNFMKFQQCSPHWTFVLLQAQESCFGENQVELPSAMIYSSILLKVCRYHAMNRIARIFQSITRIYQASMFLRCVLAAPLHHYIVKQCRTGLNRSLPPFFRNGKASSIDNLRVFGGFVTFAGRAAGPEESSAARWEATQV